MKKIAKTLLIIVLTMSFLIFITRERDPKLIIGTIESFFDTQYNSYLDMTYYDISKYLDMSKIQNQNKVIALKENVARRKRIEERGYGYIEKNRFPTSFEYESIKIDGQTAIVVFNIQIDGSQAYPFFICSGKQTIVLEKMQNEWKITDHDYESLAQFESSKTIRLPEFDLNKVNEETDDRYR